MEKMLDFKQFALASRLKISFTTGYCVKILAWQFLMLRSMSFYQSCLDILKPIPFGLQKDQIVKKKIGTFI